MKKVNKSKPKDKYIRDPIHDFIKITPDEQRIVNHPCFQRLRDISQLSFVPYVYPGATHKRFDHSLGVMKLATDIFDEVMSNKKWLRRNKFKKHLHLKKKGYWRQVVRIAALCHDIGHLPFSHTLEGLLKEETGGKNHEDLSRGIIEGALKDDIERISAGKGQGRVEASHVSIVVMNVEDREKLLLEDTVYDNIEKDWLNLVGNIICSDLFGADRMDFLIRDAYYTGVPYGNIDLFQLCRSVVTNTDKDSWSEIKVEKAHPGDVAILSSFLMARQLMYSQVYQHPVSIVYDLHLVDFVREGIKLKKIMKVESLVKCSDSYLWSKMHKSQKLKGPEYRKYREYGRIILKRDHFKLVGETDVDGIRRVHDNISGENEAGLQKLETKGYVNAKDYADEVCDHINVEVNKKRSKKKVRVINYVKLRKPEPEDVKDKRRKKANKNNLKGYRKIYSDVWGGDFSFCYIYAAPEVKDDAEEIFKKYDHEKPKKRNTQRAKRG